MPKRGGATLVSFTERIKKGLISEQLKRVDLAANELQRTILEEQFVGERTGRVYKIPPGNQGAGTMYTASAPGESPAVRTGALRRSISREPAKLEGGKIVAYVGTKLGYAADLEYGTHRVAPRPWLKPAMDKAGPRMRRLMSGNV